MVNRTHERAKHTEATVTRLQYKVTCQQEPPGNNSWELHVWFRQVVDDQEPTAWARLTMKRVYVDPMVYSGGSRLKLLLRSLA